MKRERGLHFKDLIDRGAPQAKESDFLSPSLITQFSI